MTHLSESEFVDLVEDGAGLDARRAAHVDTCASCREQADVMRALLRQAAAVEVPEPSPLFWEHMLSRVREGVAAEPATRPRWQWAGFRGLAPLAATVALIVAVVSGGLLIRAARDGRAGTAAVDRTAAATPAAERTDSVPDAENAEVWAVLTAAASDVGLEDAHDAGMHVHPAAIDHAVQDLTAAELNELGRLLQSELKRSSN
jgi:hypothetical protein